LTNARITTYTRSTLHTLAQGAVIAASRSLRTLVPVLLTLFLCWMFANLWLALAILTAWLAPWDSLAKFCSETCGERFSRHDRITAAILLEHQRELERKRDEWITRTRAELGV
jgi:hypothetical protein